MKKIYWLGLIGVCMQLSAADFLYVNNGDTFPGSTFVDTNSWYDYGKYSSTTPKEFWQLNAAPTATDNVFVLGYNIAAGATDDGSDGYGANARNIYKPFSSLIMGGNVSVNNFTIDFADGYIFESGTTAPNNTLYFNGTSSSDLSIAGTLNVVGSHSVTFNNGFNNISIGSINHTSTSDLVFSDGIKNLYIGTNSSGVSSGVVSSSSGLLKFALDAGSVAYVGKINSSGKVSVDGAGDVYFNDTFVSTGSGNPVDKHGSGKVYFKDYSSSDGFVMYGGTLSADKFVGQIHHRGGDWTNVNLLSNNSNYGDSTATSNWTNVSITGVGGQFHHYAGKLNFVSDVVVKGGTTYFMNFGDGTNYSNPDYHSVVTGDLKLQEGSSFLQRGGLWNGGTLTIEDGGNFYMHFENHSSGDVVSGTFKGDVVMTSSDAGDSNFEMNAGDFQGNISIINNPVHLAENSNTFNITGGSIKGKDGAKAQIHIENAHYGIFRGGEIYADIYFKGEEFVAWEGTAGRATTYQSGSTITSEATLFSFRPNTGETVFDGVMNLSGTGKGGDGGRVTIRSNDSYVNVKEINFNGGFKSVETQPFDRMMEVGAGTSIDIGKVTYNMDAGTPMYTQFVAGRNAGSGSTSHIRIGELNFVGLDSQADADAAGKDFSAGLRFSGSSDTDILNDITVDKITGTGYLYGGKNEGGQNIGERSRILIRNTNQLTVGTMDFEHAFAIVQEIPGDGTGWRGANFTANNIKLNNKSDVSNSNISAKSFDLTGTLEFTNSRASGDSLLNIEVVEHLNMNKIVMGSGGHSQLELRSKESNIYIKSLDMSASGSKNLLIDGAVASSGGSHVKIDNMILNPDTTVFASGYSNVGAGTTRVFEIGRLSGGSTNTKFTILGDYTSNTQFIIGSNAFGTSIYSGKFDPNANSKFSLVKVGTNKQVLNGSLNKFEGGVEVREGHLSLNTNYFATKVVMNGGTLSTTVTNFSVDTLTYNGGTFYFDLNQFYYDFEFESTLDLIVTGGSGLDAADFRFANMGNFLEGVDYAVLFRFSDYGDELVADLLALVGNEYEFKDAETYDTYLGKFTYEYGEFGISFVLIPEPSTYAIIFGLLALAFAFYRKRK